MGRGVGRYATLSLIAGQGVTNWSFRNGLPSWLPFVGGALGYTDACAPPAPHCCRSRFHPRVAVVTGRARCCWRRSSLAT